MTDGATGRTALPDRAQALGLHEIDLERQGTRVSPGELQLPGCAAAQALRTASTPIRLEEEPNREP